MVLLNENDEADEVHQAKLRVLVYAAFFLPGFKGGGPIKTLSNLIERTTDEIYYRVVTKDRDLGELRPYEGVRANKWLLRNGYSIIYCSPGVFGKFRLLFQVFKSEYDILYLNSFFSFSFSILPLLLGKALGRTVVIGPRGEFSPGALGIKSMKKRVFIYFYRMLRFQKGVLFQASSNFESTDIKKILGDCVDVYVSEDIGSLEFPKCLRRKEFALLRIVFLSRISAKKNLTKALEILMDVDFDVSFDIYGPVEDPVYWDRCRELINRLPPNVLVEYKGELRPENVIGVLAGYDLFFFPTLGENYGHVIAEALCAGLPVLISDSTPWRGLRELKIGWDLPLDSTARFVDALTEVASMSPGDLMRMREGVLEWAQKRFSCAAAVESNKAMFRYALGARQK